MRETFLPFSPPLIGEEEIAEVVDTLRTDWITTGPKVKRFEEEFRQYVGAPAALALNSCTAALHVALAALGVGPGDTVITTPLTFCSSVHVIEHTGARPLMADVSPDTLNIDPARVEEAVESVIKSGGRVRALLPVHLYGHPCDMGALMALARDHRLAVVEDAAHALPASHEGRTVGSFASHYGDVPVFTCFSFYATKNLTTAEGGMLTGPQALVDEARVWSLHGMSRDAWNRYGEKGSWYYEVVRAGFKYNMTDIQAALGLHQLRKLDSFQRRRAEIVSRYDEAFSRIEELTLPGRRPEVGHAWHLYVVRLKLERLTITREQFIEELKERRIGTSVHFIPVHTHPYYRDKYGYRPEDFPVAYGEFRRMVSLPLNPRMSDRDVEDVIEAVSDVVGKFRR
ncbi:MAG TPA: DegT/DnrJ/EryC1/StrS aminotransferase family protein [Pyrinomonadaceae bacterium]|nr:DegT/DnrJ/EryC1/StrS aminotransferase family protein [Pyrinomonadaceae bacterium]